MAKKIVQDEVPDFHWQVRRPEQGYSYNEVLREITRRMKGDYLLAEEERTDVYNAGVRRAAMRFALSSTFSDVLKAFELTQESLLGLVGCTKDDPAEILLACILDPFSKVDGTPIALDENIDDVYPGRKVVRTK